MMYKPYAVVNGPWLTKSPITERPEKPHRCSMQAATEKVVRRTTPRKTLLSPRARYFKALCIEDNCSVYQVPIWNLNQITVVVLRVDESHPKNPINLLGTHCMEPELPPKLQHR